MTNPYELWDTNTFLGVYRDIDPDPLYWMQWFPFQAETDADGYIDFEKMPIQDRSLAPFVLPLGRGKSVYTDQTTHYRFKPAYVKLEDQIDPLMPLRRRAGIDPNMSQMPVPLTPMQRLDLIRAAITESHVRAIRRTWNYMACVALRDGQITLRGENYPTTVVNFRRSADHLITLGVGDRFGDSDVSIVDFFQSVIDTMTTSPFGAMPTRATMGGAVWTVMRKDVELLKFMDRDVRGGNITIERGLVAGGSELVYKVGEMMIGGASGQMIELWVDNSTYKDPLTGTDTRYIAANQILFTGTAEAVMGHQAFGTIIDRAAEYASTPIFPKNWITQGDVEVEYITHKSAPLMVPINPNATLLANVIAAA